MGYDEVTVNGKKFKKIDYQYAGPEKGKEEVLFNWLKSEGYGNNIKPKGESIHGKTLAKIINESAEQGVIVPACTMTTRTKIRVS